MSSSLPDDLTYLSLKLPKERILKLLSTWDVSLTNLSKDIGGRETVVQYLDEIEKERTSNKYLDGLTKAIGIDRVARYLYYIDSKNYLETCPGYEIVKESLGAVLLNPDIRALCGTEIKVPLMHPTEDGKCWKESASYALRLGSRYRVHRKEGWLKPGEKLRIPPHGIAMTTTYEWLNMPGYLIGRWNLKVKKVYHGLVWVGSLQVDPGYQGFLSCPLYNLSTEEQVLECGEPLFIIDFVKTIPFDTKRHCKLWELPERYSTFDFHRLDTDKIQSAPESDIASLKTEIKGFQNQFYVMTGILLAIVALVVAVIAIFPSIGQKADIAKYFDQTPLIFIVLGTLAALVFSLLAFLKKK